MNLSDLPRADLRRRLSGDALRLRIGPFVVNLRSSLAGVCDGLERMYGQYPVCSHETFADFHVELRRPRSIRRWLRPQVVFAMDGDVPFKPLPVVQAFPLFEWGLNWCVANYAHQYLLVHAGVVAGNDRCLILPGEPGSGKSTLCAALVSEGWRLLSDEVAMVDPADHWIVPLPRPISLKNESIDVIRAFARDAVLGPPYTDTHKGAVAHMRAPVGAVSSMDQRAEAAWIVWPRYEPGAETELIPRSKATALVDLASNAFNYSVHRTQGFEVCADLVDRSECYHLRYSNLAEAVAVFQNLGFHSATRTRQAAG